ncbi:MAG: 2TM domain-containing protein [Marinirhabdus sp.]
MKTQDRNESLKYRMAVDRIKELREFYWHLSIYSIFVLVFIVLNVMTTSFPWAIFPILGWGTGLASHAACTFNWYPLFGKDWEARKIKEYMAKDSTSTF